MVNPFEPKTFTTTCDNGPLNDRSIRLCVWYTLRLVQIQSYKILDVMKNNERSTSSTNSLLDTYFFCWQCTSHSESKVFCLLGNSWVTATLILYPEPLLSILTIVIVVLRQLFQCVCSSPPSGLKVNGCQFTDSEGNSSHFKEKKVCD